MINLEIYLNVLNCRIDLQCHLYSYIYIIMQFSSSQITCIFATILNFSIFVFLFLYLYHCICIFVSVFFYRYSRSYILVTVYPCISILVSVFFYRYSRSYILVSVSLHQYSCICIIVSLYSVLWRLFLKGSRLCFPRNDSWSFIYSFIFYLFIYVS